MPAAFKDSLQLLGTRRFGTFWFASLLSNIGTWAQLVAQPWLLLSLGASSFLIGLDTFAMSAPTWLLTLPGGLLADRADRRRVIGAFQSLQMLCPTIVVLLLLAGTVRPWTIILLSLIIGITDALSMPSFASIVPSIVQREQIAAGLALNSTQFNISRIAGPALAGVLIASVGVIGCFVVSAASYIPFIGVALWILPRRLPGPEKQAQPHLDLTHPFAGAAVIARDGPLRGALLTALSSGFLCGPLITFCPVLVKNVLHGDAAHFSLAMGAFGIGGLLGGVALLGVAAQHDRRWLSCGVALAYGVTLLAVALNPWLALLPGLLVVAGIAMSVTNIATNTLVQTAAPPAVRGQAVSLFMLVSRGGVALGSLATGLSVSFLGVREALLINGSLAIAAQLQIARTWLRSAART